MSIIKDIKIAYDNSIKLKDIWYLTKNDYKNEWGKVSIYKLIIRPMFFFLTDGDLAHELVIRIGKLLLWKK